MPSDDDERVLCSHIDTSVKCHSHAAICRNKGDEKLCGEEKMLRTPLKSENNIFLLFLLKKLKNIKASDLHHE